MWDIILPFWKVKFSNTKCPIGQKKWVELSFLMEGYLQINKTSKCPDSNQIVKSKVKHWYTPIYY